VQLHAKIDLERTIIRSPINGVIVGRNVSEGQTVASSLEAPTLFMIAGDLEHMDIHARVDESDIGKIKVGQKATFTVDAHPERSFVAQVAAVRKAPQAAQQSASGMRRAPQTPSNVVTYTVVLRTSNSDGLLLPGMTALVRIVIEEAKDVLMVPMSAFRFAPRSEERRVSAGQRPGRNNELVWVWDDGRGVRPVSVEVGTTDGVHAGVVNSAVPNGLRDGDQVVVAEAGDAAPKRLLGVKFGF
jgi:HlyD family secretion protein